MAGVRGTVFEKNGNDTCVILNPYVPMYIEAEEDASQTGGILRALLSYVALGTTDTNGPSTDYDSVDISANGDMRFGFIRDKDLSADFIGICPSRLRWLDSTLYLGSGSRSIEGGIFTASGGFLRVNSTNTGQNVHFYPQYSADTTQYCSMLECAVVSTANADQYTISTRLNTTRYTNTDADVIPVPPTTKTITTITLTGGFPRFGIIYSPWDNAALRVHAVSYQAITA